MKGEEAYGTIGKKAKEFVDFLARSNQRIWQVLPLTQVDSYLSPYSSPDSFAANHLLIDLKSLDQDKVLDSDDWNIIKNKDKEEYKKNKENLLKKIFLSWIKKEKNREGLKEFYHKEKWWLEDHLRYYSHINKEENPEYLIFLQKIFMDQYLVLKKYANDKDICIFGDLPFYVNHKSRDVFMDSKYFYLDKNGIPLYQGGVPPDSFQEKGQLWGTPVYNWEKMQEDGFTYWVKKIKRLSYLYDYLRIDHFRGLEAYFIVDWGATDTTFGKWVKAPGEELLDILTKSVDVKIVAENLGYITPEVDYLLEKYNIPGMKVLQFIEEDLYLQKEKKDTIYYTGTHDNQTLLSWIRKKFEPEDFLEEDIVWDFIKKVYYSKAAWSIISFQDLLFLDDSARMNTPGTVDNNWDWTWDGDFNALKELEEKLIKLTKRSERS